MDDFEKIWNLIKKNQGKIFYTKKRLQFTYRVEDDYLIPSTTDFRLSKENFRKAFSQIPLKGPSYFSKDIMGSSYVWGIFNDKQTVIF